MPERKDCSPRLGCRLSRFAAMVLDSFDRCSRLLRGRNRFSVVGEEVLGFRWPDHACPFYVAMQNACGPTNVPLHEPRMNGAHKAAAVSAVPNQGCRSSEAHESREREALALVNCPERNHSSGPSEGLQAGAPG